MYVSSEHSPNCSLYHIKGKEKQATGVNEVQSVLCEDAVYLKISKRKICQIIVFSNCLGNGIINSAIIIIINSAIVVVYIKLCTVAHRIVQIIKKIYLVCIIIYNKIINNLFYYLLSRSSCNNIAVQVPILYSYFVPLVIFLLQMAFDLSVI